MNVESARYDGNGTIIAVIDGETMFVPDDMDNRHRQAIAEWEAAGNTIEPYVAPAPPPPAPIVLPADVFFERTTEAEADEIDAAMTAKPVKIRRAWQAANEFREGTDLWVTLRGVIVDLYGEDRAAELMARPTASMSAPVENTEAA